jgi:hypothetical protein
MKQPKDGEILLKDALQAMELKDENGEQVKFNVRFFKFSKHKKKENGEIREYKNVIACGLPFSMKDHNQRGIKLENNETRVFNIFLLDRFNNLKVIR